ncbi:hypothetical protein QYF36_006555 [Acer negundo]|nr:hypothetical protein QYF36_006555 [Acer negundo]
MGSILMGDTDKRNDTHWKAPSTGYYKVNCSVMTGLGGKRIGISIVIRNCLGVVMASCSQAMNANFDGHGVSIMAHISSGKFMDANFGSLLEDIANLN